MVGVASPRPATLCYPTQEVPRLGLAWQERNKKAARAKPSPPFMKSSCPGLASCKMQETRFKTGSPAYPSTVSSACLDSRDTVLGYAGHGAGWKYFVFFPTTMNCCTELWFLRFVKSCEISGIPRLHKKRRCLTASPLFILLGMTKCGGIFLKIPASSAPFGNFEEIFPKGAGQAGMTKIG